MMLGAWHSPHVVEPSLLGRAIEGEQRRTEDG